MVDSHVVVLLLFYIVLTIPMLVTLALILRRRTQQPIKYRGVWLLFVSGIGILIAWSWYMLFLVFEVSSASTHSAAPQDDGHPVGSRRFFCGSWQWILWMSNGAIMAGYFLRSVRILKIFHDHTTWVSPLTMQQQLNAEQMAHPASSSASGAHVNSAGVSSNVGLLSLGGAHARKLDARVYTERFMLSILFGLLLFLVALKLILDYAANVPLAYSGFGCHQSEVWGWLGVDAAEILFLLLGIWKLRAIRDDYGISTELTTVCVIWIICSLGLAISILLRRSDVAHAFGGSSALNEEAYLEFQSALWAVRNLAIFFTSLTWPLIQSYYNSFPPLWSNCDALCSLETLLKDIVCIQYFRNYLMSVSRVEWILAWVEMELFRDLDPEDTEVLGEQARRIYEKYVQLGAELEVHLSPASVHRLTREVHVGAPDAGCFEEAQAELFQLMEAEFPRFLSSPACESCLHELEKEEVLREVLEKSNMI